MSTIIGNTAQLFQAGRNDCKHLLARYYDLKELYYCCGDQDLCGCCGKDGPGPGDFGGVARCEKITKEMEKIAKEYERCMSPQTESILGAVPLPAIQYIMSSFTSMPTVQQLENLTSAQIFSRTPELHQSREANNNSVMLVELNEDGILKLLCEKANSVWSRPKPYDPNNPNHLDPKNDPPGKTDNFYLDCGIKGGCSDCVPCPDCIKKRWHCNTVAECLGQALRILQNDSIYYANWHCLPNPRPVDQGGCDCCLDLLFKKQKLDDLIKELGCANAKNETRCLIEKLLKMQPGKRMTYIEKLLEIYKDFGNRGAMGNFPEDGLYGFFKELNDKPTQEPSPPAPPMETMVYDVLKKLLSGSYAAPPPPPNNPNPIQGQGGTPVGWSPADLPPPTPSPNNRPSQGGSSKPSSGE